MDKPSEDSLLPANCASLGFVCGPTATGGPSGGGIWGKVSQVRRGAGPDSAGIGGTELGIRHKGRRDGGCDGGVPREAENGRNNQVTRKQPNNCSSRVPEVPHGDPGHLRSCREVGEQLPNTRRKVAPELRFGPSSTRIGRSGSNFGRSVHLATFDKCWSMASHIRPKSTTMLPYSANVCRNLPPVGQLRPISEQLFGSFPLCMSALLGLSANAAIAITQLGVRRSSMPNRCPPRVCGAAAGG